MLRSPPSYTAASPPRFPCQPVGDGDPLIRAKFIITGCYSICNRNFLHDCHFRAYWGPLRGVKLQMFKSSLTSRVIRGRPDIHTYIHNGDMTVLFAISLSLSNKPCPLSLSRLFLFSFLRLLLPEQPKRAQEHCCLSQQLSQK